MEATLPKEMFDGHDCKPGDIVDMKIVSMDDSGVKVEYVPGEDEVSSEPMKPEDMADKAKTDAISKLPVDKMRQMLPKADREGY